MTYVVDMLTGVIMAMAQSKEEAQEKALSDLGLAN